MPIVKKFVTNLQRLFSLPTRDFHDGTIILCVSGGPDSMAMMHLFHRIRRWKVLKSFQDIFVVTVNHNLRPGSADEADFVVDEAYKLGFTCRRIDINVPTEGNLENNARIARYTAICNELHVVYKPILFTAHHLDDQAETVFMRMIRGAGFNGLSGICEIFGEDDNIKPDHLRGVECVIRPLIPFTKVELLEYLESVGGKYVIDPTNEDGNDRAKIRNLVFPYIKEVLGRDPRAPLARIAELASESELARQRDIFSRTIIVKGLRPGLKQTDLQLGKNDNH